MGESLAYTPGCMHGVPFMQTCPQCGVNTGAVPNAPITTTGLPLRTCLYCGGQWSGSGLNHPNCPVLTSTPSRVIPQAVPSSDERMLGYLDLIAECLVTLAWKAKPDAGRRDQKLAHLRRPADE
jgi:hypothetical protein